MMSYTEQSDTNPDGGVRRKTEFEEFAVARQNRHEELRRFVAGESHTLTKFGFVWENISPKIGAPFVRIMRDDIVFKIFPNDRGYSVRISGELFEKYLWRKNPALRGQHERVIVATTSEIRSHLTEVMKMLVGGA